MSLDAVDPSVRIAVLTAYDSMSPIGCRCCHNTTPEFLNVIPERLDENGKQIMRRNDAPMTARDWLRLQQKGYPDGYVIYCSNCVAAHQLGDCPYAS